MRRKLFSNSGFTLIELMIVVAIIAILAAIAIPSYRSQIVKSRRIDAERVLVQTAQLHERYFTANGRYTTASGGSTCGATTPAATSTYTYSATCDDTTFSLTATPVAGSSQANDGNLTLDNTNAKSTNWTE